MEGLKDKSKAIEKKLKQALDDGVSSMNQL